MSDPTPPNGLPSDEGAKPAVAEPAVATPAGAEPTVAEPAGGAPAAYGPPAGYPAPAAYSAPAGYPGAPPQSAPSATPPYASGVYGAPPAQPYGVAAVAPGGPPGRPRVLAIVGLALAVLGLVLAFIPIITWFSGLFLLAGFILGLIALISKKQGGTGLAIGAVAVSVVGWIISIVVTIASFAVIGQAAQDAVDDGRDAAITEPTDAPADGEDAAAAQPLQIAETAFGRDSFGDTWWYVVVLDNPNADHVYDFATFEIEALAADGTILDSSTEYVTLLSGRSALAGGFLAVGAGEIASLEVRGPDATEAVFAPGAETGSFAVADIASTTDDYSTTVTGTVSGTFEDEQEFVNVVVVARDPGGALIGGAYTYVERLPNDGGAVPFEALFYEPLPEGTAFEAYPSL